MGCELWVFKLWVVSYGLWIKVHLSLCSNQNKKSFVPLSSIKFKISAIATDRTLHSKKPTTHYPQLTTHIAFQPTTQNA